MAGTRELSENKIDIIISYKIVNDLFIAEERSYVMQYS